MKKILASLLIGIFALTSCTKDEWPVLFTKDDSKIQIYFFHGAECPACAKQKEIWTEILPKYPNVELIDFEVWHSKRNSDLMQYVADKKWIRLTNIPASLIWDEWFVWVNTEDIVKKLDALTTDKTLNKDTILPIIKDFNEEKYPWKTNIIQENNTTKIELVK